VTQSSYDNSPYNRFSPQDSPHESSPYHDPATLPDGWPVVSHVHLVAFGICAVLFWLVILMSRMQFVWAIDHANVAIHETGHLLFRPLGFTMHMWGGTLFQLLMPLVIGVYFWRKRQAAGVAVMGLWLGKSLLHVAVYVADAKAMVLPLVGGNVHDWRFILGRFGCVDNCTTIAAVIQVVAWLLMFAAAGWYVWRWWVSVEYARQRAHSQ